VAERDGAAVDVDAVQVGLVHLRPRQHDGCERLVDLEQVEVRHRHPRPVEDLAGRVDGAVEQVVRVGPDDELVQQPRPRPQPELPGLLLRHPQHRGGAVGDLRRVAGGDHLALDDGLELGETLHRRLPQTLVTVDRHGRAVGLRDVGHRDDLALEPALGPRHRRLLLRLQTPLVEVRT
jgi:hypothetical protein